MDIDMPTPLVDDVNRAGVANDDTGVFPHSFSVGVIHGLR